MDRQEYIRNLPTHVILVLNDGEYRCVVDAEDVVRIAPYSWRAKSSNGGTHVYAVGIVDGESTPMHRFLMSPPSDMVIDHINHDTLDNRKANLRICTHAENMRNRASNILRPEGYLPWVNKLALEGTLLLEQAYSHEVEMLSDREFDVFHGLTAGKAIHDLAQELGISPSTVSTMRMRALKKLGCKSNADLVRIAEGLPVR